MLVSPGPVRGQRTLNMLVSPRPLNMLVSPRHVRGQRTLNMLVSSRPLNMLVSPSQAYQRTEDFMSVSRKMELALYGGI